MPAMNMMPGGTTLQIPLDAPTAFSASAGSTQVTLTWTDPLDKYATPEGETAQDPNQLVSVWDHTVLVRKTGSQPAGPNDGTVVVSSSVRNQYQSSGYVDAGLQNDTTYYYGVFAYNADRVASPGAFANATPMSFSPILNNNTWEQISLASPSASSIWSIGDCKSVPLNGKIAWLTINTTLWVFILGFNHNAALEGNGITFGGFKTAQTDGIDVCLIDSFYGNSNDYNTFRMNMSSTNSGGWESSTMRNTICGTNNDTSTQNFPFAIPEDLRSVVKPVTKYTNNVGKSSSASAVTATTDYFFLPAEYEVFGTITYANVYEANYQQQYAYYSAGNSKVKYKHNSTGDYVAWWLRSSSAGTSVNFVIVTVSGGSFYNSARTSLGFAPCFVV